MKIESKDSEVLEIKLSDLLDLIPSSQNNTWSILNLEAVGNSNFIGSVLDLERTIEESPNGLTMTTDELQKLSKKLVQIIDLTLIGDSAINNLKRFQIIEEAYDNCTYVLQLIDSSYWIVNANTSFIEAIKNRFKAGNVLTFL